MRLVTVPHSGTTWTRELLDGWGEEFTTHHAWETGFPHPWVAEDEIVCTARDPVLVEISALNRGRWVDFHLWETLEGWMGKKNVHFFRIDCPEDARDAEIRALAAFLDAELHGEVDWSPKNTSSDRLGLKKAYRSGEIPPELDRIWGYLTESAAAPRIQAMFRGLGYDLPWMSP